MLTAPHPSAPLPHQGVVKNIDATAITLTDGTVLPYGLCIWSTGVGPTPFTTSLPFSKTRVGRLAVDQYLRVQAPDKVDAAGHVRVSGGGGYDGDGADEVAGS